MIFGMAAGIVAAVWRNRWPDRLGMALAVTGISFRLSRARYAADAGSGGTGLAADGGGRIGGTIFCPSLTLGAAVAAVMARFTRASFVDVLHEDYMRTRAPKGQ